MLHRKFLTVVLADQHCAFCVPVKTPFQTKGLLTTGKYIEAFGGCETGSVEYEALCEGIQALMANRQ